MLNPKWLCFAIWLELALVPFQKTVYFYVRCKQPNRHTVYSAVRLGHFTELTRGLTATAVCKVDLSHWKATKEERAFASPSFTNRGEIFSEGAYFIHLHFLQDIYQGPHHDHYKRPILYLVFVLSLT